MAIYHLSVKPISRSAGRSATGAAAYRAGCEITDERTGLVHDYRRKGGVESTDIVLPDGAPAWAQNRARLWNAAELAEKRKDSCVAREYEVALPHELSSAERRQLVLEFAKEMANREGCAVDVAIHAPSRGGDNRNHHAHIMRTTRKVGPDGLTEKLDTEKSGRDRKADLEGVRARWAELCNKRLMEKQLTTRVDHRSLAEQGIQQEPSVHLGPAVVELERRGVDTNVKRRIFDSMVDRLRRVERAAKKLADLAFNKAHQVGQVIKEQPKRPAIDRLPIAQQEEFFERTRQKLAAERQAKAQRVAAKAWERYQRRGKVTDEIRGAAPTEPTGMFAAFKKKAYDESLAVWNKAWSHARKLEDQANLLYGKLADAAQNHRVLGWAYNHLKAKDPALVQRLEGHRKEERQRKLSAELQERLAKKNADLGRGR